MEGNAPIDLFLFSLLKKAGRGGPSLCVYVQHNAPENDPISAGVQKVARRGR